MAREIDMNDLSIEDRKYLQDRDQLPDGELPVRVTKDGELVDAYGPGEDGEEDTEVFG